MGTEHQKYTRLYEPEKPAVAVCSINLGHCFDFSGASELGRTSEYFASLVKEAFEIDLNENDFHRSGSFILTQARSPVTSTLINEKQDQAEQILDFAY